MSSQQVRAEPESKVNRTRTSMLLRAVGFLFLAVLTILFGLVPFLLGFVTQALSPRRIPPFVVGSVAAAAFFVLWHFTGGLSLTIGDGNPIWASALVSLIVFVPFFASGAASFRQLVPRRFGTLSAS